MIILTGCTPKSVSIQPLYSDDTIVFEEALLGKWFDNEVVWEFKGGSEYGYDIRVFDMFESNFKGYLVELDGMLYLDLFPESNVMCSEFYADHYQPMHTIMRIDQIEPVLQMSGMNTAETRRILEENDINIDFADIGNDLVFTASTVSMQDLVINYNTELFDGHAEYVRRELIFSNDDIVFDESLIGIWEGDNDLLLKIESSDNITYEITALADGRAFRISAALFEIDDIDVLGLSFGDGCILDCNEAPLPDMYMITEIQGDVFKMETISYDDLLEAILNQDQNIKDVLEYPSETFIRLK